MLRDMDMTKFKEMQELDSSLHALLMNTKWNNSRYCISNDLPCERRRNLDNPGLLLLPEKLRDKDLRKRLKQSSELASEHANTLQVEMDTYYDKKQPAEIAGGRSASSCIIA